MAVTEKEAENLIRIWEKAVDTQMHFNEMSVKSRQLGFTFVAAALGVASFLLSRGTDFSILIPTPCGKFTLHVSVFLIMFSIIAVVAIRRLDLAVYHRMLRGAVTFGEDFEENYLKAIISLEKGMTQAISHYSRYDDADKKTVDGKYHYTGTRFFTAEHKLRRFYFYVICALALSALVIFIITNIGSFQAPKAPG